MDICGKGRQIASVVEIIQDVCDLDQDQRELHIQHSLDIHNRCERCTQREISDLYFEGREGVEELLVLLSYLESCLSVVHEVVVLSYQTNGE